MLVHFDDQDYEFDIEALDLTEARHIKRQTGLTVKGLMEGLGEMDPEALAALYWLMLKQNGKVTDMHKLNFSVLKFGEAIGAAFEKEAENNDESPTVAPEAAPSQA